MSFSSTTQLQSSEIIQDTMPSASNFDNEGDNLSATEVGTNQTIGKLVRWVMGLSRMLGEANRRRGAVKFHGADTPLTGTITSSGTTVTGSGTLFLTELAVGDFIAGTAFEYREVTAIGGDLTLTIASAFTTTIVSGQAAVRIQTLAERLEGFLSIKGLLNGGLVFNSTTLPPSIRDGGYEINGRTVSLTATATLALTDVFLQSKQGLDSFCQYLVCMDNTGSKKFVLYGEGAVSGATGTITSITGAGTTKTLTINTGTGGTHTNKILVVTGNTGVNGVFKITGGNGSTTYTFESVTTLTGTGGTWTIYERTSTLHGTGSNAAITTDADVIKYTPSYGENGWSAGIAAWNATLQGYYLTITGLTGYRVLGNFRTNTTPNVITDIVSHKSGRDKNDNNWLLTAFSSLVTNAVRFTTPQYLRGSDYLYTDDGTYGTEIKFYKNGFVNGLFTNHASGGSLYCSILISPTTTNTYNEDSIYQYSDYSPSPSSQGTITAFADVFTNHIMKCMSEATPTSGNNRIRFGGKFQL